MKGEGAVFQTVYDIPDPEPRQGYTMFDARGKFGRK
jgi:hypothetical protein